MKWIKSPSGSGDAAVTFVRKMMLKKKPLSARLLVSAVGIYEAAMDGKRIGSRLFTPGFTSYHNRIQYQEYDVSEDLRDGSVLEITVANGWAAGHLGFVGKRQLYADHTDLWVNLCVTYADGSEEIVSTDEDWLVYTHEVTFADIYDGETVDKTHTPTLLGNALADEISWPLVADVGEPILEQESFVPTLFTTPKGERVLDFHQNMTGYVALDIRGRRGDRVELSFGEILDRDGNFYNENYRLAKNKITYILSGEQDHFKPRFSFQGFRYVRLDAYPFEEVDADGFRGIVVHSDMKRIGHFSCGNEKINQLYHNLVWGQKGNYLDIPTDCPQRDERLGWTGDAQVFCRTAAINYDVRRFFDKWLADLRAEQSAEGAIYGTCPEIEGMHRRAHSRISAGWGDAATIIPWTLYELYGEKKFLADNFEMMRRWVEYMRGEGHEEYLWLGGNQFGDWLGMDAGGDTYEGATSKDLIGSAFYAYSTELLVRAGEALGRDVSFYKELHERVVSAFRDRFMKDGLPLEHTPPEGSRGTVRTGMTQTGIALILRFGLCTEAEKPRLTDRLAELVHDFGDRMSTGFLGTPHLLHALSENGRTELAYQLLFNEENPSWLYSVNHGATTIWEHWNGIKEDGSLWSVDMNSFNHYAYGAVGDWLYGVAAGICPKAPGYQRVTLAPKPHRGLGRVDCSVETPLGTLESHWCCEGEEIRFSFVIPCGMEATVLLPNGEEHPVAAGTHSFAIKE